MTAIASDYDSPCDANGEAIHRAQKKMIVAGADDPQLARIGAAGDADTGQGTERAEHAVQSAGRDVAGRECTTARLSSCPRYRSGASSRADHPQTGAEGTHEAGFKAQSRAASMRCNERNNKATCNPYPTAPSNSPATAECHGGNVSLMPTIITQRMTDDKTKRSTSNDVMWICAAYANLARITIVLKPPAAMRQRINPSRCTIMGERNTIGLPCGDRRAAWSTGPL
jgi:hypothetical protein